MIDRIVYSQPSYAINSNIRNSNSVVSAAGNNYQVQNSTSPAEEKTAQPGYAADGNNALNRYPQDQLPGLLNRSAVLDKSADEASAAYGKTVEEAQANDKLLKRMGLKECKTCSERRYQDESGDPGVSFKAPAHIAPGSAGAAVAAHEQEHVRHEQANAAREEKRVISQSVRIFTATCPECGRVYVSGGETRTVTATKSAPPQTASQPGQLVDLYA